MAERIDLNNAGVGELTQLPGVAKNVAYKIVNHRDRHGFFTNWEELREVKGFPIDRLDEIKERATLSIPPEVGTRRASVDQHLERVAKKPSGYTKAIRSTRRKDRMQQTRTVGRKSA